MTDRRDGEPQGLLLAEKGAGQVVAFLLWAVKCVWNQGGRSEEGLWWACSTDR